MKKKERLEWETKALQRIVEVIELAKDLYGDECDVLDYVETDFGLRGYAAGQARWTNDFERIQVRINMEAFMKDPDDMLNDTIPHELAHLVCAVMFWEKGHGPKWVRTCQQLGGTGNRTHSMQLTSVRKQKRFLYINENGAEVHFKQGRHSNLQKGKAQYYATKTQQWYKHHFISEVIITPQGRIEVSENENSTETDGR